MTFRIQKRTTYQVRKRACAANPTHGQLQKCENMHQQTDSAQFRQKQDRTWRSAFTSELKAQVEDAKAQCDMRRSNVITKPRTVSNVPSTADRRGTRATTAL